MAWDGCGDGLDDLEEDVDKGSEEAEGLNGEEDLVAIGEELGERAMENNVEAEVDEHGES